MKRQQSVSAKNSHFDWIGPFLVTNTADCIVEIQKNAENRDFVHRSHVIKKHDRPEHLVTGMGNQPVENLTPGLFKEKNILDTEEFADINFGKRCRFPTNKLQIDGRKKSYE